MRVPIILALFLISAALCNADSCQWQTSDGNNKYDLSSLVGKGSAEHGYYKAVCAGGENLFYNLCGGVTEGGGCNGNSAGCQVDNNGDPWSLGSIQAYSGSAHPNGPDKGFRMTYTNGDSAGCPAARRMTVTYTCDEGASKPSLSKVAEPMPCDYTFTMTTKQACPNLSQAGLGGMSLGTLLLILIGVSVVIYIGAGIAINVKKFGKTGVEAFPNLEFWKSIPGLAKDGVMFVVNKVTKRGGSSYQEVEG